MTAPLVPEDLARNGLTPLVRAALCIGLAKLDRNLPAAEHARQRFGNDRTLDLVLRAATSPTSLTGSPQLAQVAVAFLKALAPVSAGADLLMRGVGLNFDGAASIAVPAISIPVADFVGEGIPIPVVQSVTTSGPTLSPHKLAVLTSLTGEMMRNSNAETLIRQVLIESTGPAVDKVLFSANAAAADRPAGLLNSITGLTPAAAGEKSQIIVDDLQALTLAIAPVSGNGDFVIVASADAATALRLRLPTSVQWPALQSSALPAKTVIVVALNALVSAIDGSPLIDTYSQGEFVPNTTPQEIVTVGGVVGSPIGSLFQTDSVALRLRWPISWALRDVRGLSWMTAVNW
jgi:hypothetical protein